MAVSGVGGSMKKVNGGIFLPDDETDQIMLYAGIQYQKNKLQAALRYVKNARLAVDVGAHCGIWSIGLGQYFDRVECFEPLQRHIECWKKNAGWKQTVKLHEVALGDMPGTCGMTEVEGQSGKSHVSPRGFGTTPVSTLDEFGYTDLDFLKVDVEGFELFVLKGGEETLKACKPVIIVEQKPGTASKYGVGETEAVKYLQSLGAELQEQITGDYIMAWE
jgi:FkbM family methyltransferase